MSFFNTCQCVEGDIYGPRSVSKAPTAPFAFGGHEFPQVGKVQFFGRHGFSVRKLVRVPFQG